jgi:hypothetical protein
VAMVRTRTIGLVEQVWRALEWITDDVAGLEEPLLFVARGLTPALFLPTAYAPPARECAFAHGLVLVRLRRRGFRRAVESFADLDLCA